MHALFLVNDARMRIPDPFQFLWHPTLFLVLYCSLCPLIASDPMDRGGAGRSENGQCGDQRITAQRKINFMRCSLHADIKEQNSTYRRKLDNPVHM